MNNVVILPLPLFPFHAVLDGRLLDSCGPVQPPCLDPSVPTFSPVPSSKHICLGSQSSLGICEGPYLLLIHLRLTIACEVGSSLVEQQAEEADSEATVRL